MGALKAELEARPLLVAAGGLALGVTVLHHPWNCLFLIPLFAFLAGLRGRLMVVLGAVFGLVIAPSPIRTQTARQYVSLNGRVASAPRAGAYGVSFVFSTSEGDWIAETAAQDAPTLGDTIRIEGVASPPREPGGVIGVVKVKRLYRTSNGAFWYRWASAARGEFSGFVSRAAPDAGVASMIEALTISAPGQLPGEVRRGAQRLGASSTMLGAGLHLFWIGLALDWLISVLPVPRVARLTLCTLALAFYAMMCGFEPAGLRAVVPVVAYRWAPTVRREPDWMSAIALGFIVQIVMQPSAVEGFGFQAAVAALFGIRLALGHRGRTRGWASRSAAWVGRLLAFAIAASAAVAPLQAQWFGWVSLSPVLVGWLAFAVAPLVCWLAGLGWLLSWISFSAGTWVVVSLASPIASFLAHAFAAFFPDPLAWHGIPAFSGYWLVAVYGVGLLFYRVPERPC